jgi:rfaE bifunctional protein kinase chain/domain
MTPEAFRSLHARYAALRVGIAGDYCLDRYLEIDPTLAEVSIETGREVHNVVRVRSQPGAAGTVLNNLAALGVGRIFPIGFAGEDGEGWELARALRGTAGVEMGHFVVTPERRTWTYTKPLVTEAGKEPRELNRLDTKNWTPTPPSVTERICRSLRELAGDLDALVVLEQSELPEVGVVHSSVLREVEGIARARPRLPILGDSRRGLAHFPPVVFKMNRAELQRMCGLRGPPSLDEVRRHAPGLARRTGRRVFVTLSEEGIFGCDPDGRGWHLPNPPLRGPTDVVGAGDAVMANLAAALAAGADTASAIAIAAAAASVVVHQVGTTGAATAGEIARLLGGNDAGH